MSFEITFSDDKTRRYDDGERFTINDNGTLTITGSDEVRIYAAHAWKMLKTKPGGGGVW